MLKGKNRILRSIIILIIVLFFGWKYFCYFERKSIYYPGEKIEYNPGQLRLRYEDIFLTTEDGLRINGWYVPAPEAKGTLIFCHGNAGNISDRLEFVDLFNRLKLNTFIFDYRGYGQSRGKADEQGTYKDARTAYNYVCSRADVDKNRIIIYGESLGAAVAIDLACQKDIQAGALITFGGFTSTQDMARVLYPFLPLWRLVSMKYDSISKIKRITIPKLIIHSSDDEVIPFAQGKRLFEAAGGPKEFYILRDGHNESMLIHREEVSKRMEQFLTTYGF